MIVSIHIFLIGGQTVGKRWANKNFEAIFYRLPTKMPRNRMATLFLSCCSYKIGGQIKFLFLLVRFAYLLWYHYHKKMTTVFISHKHDDLNELKDLIGFLETNYDVKAYIDSRDPEMPRITSGETANRIKKRIKECNKFILLATNNAIESKWCNWELGYGDAQKFKDNIALFPIKPKNSLDSLYKGNEYMAIYPYITYFYGTEKYTDGNTISKGYYVRTQKPDGSGIITPLKNWLLNI